MRLFHLLIGLLGMVAAQYSNFNEPFAGEVINGGSDFIVEVFDSDTAPYFYQMTSLSLLLLSGNSSHPLNIYAWDLNNTDPSTVWNSITIPPSIGPNAITSYFMAIRGTLLSNASVTVTYFSDRFTLTNMTGAITPAFSSENQNQDPLGTGGWWFTCFPNDVDYCVPDELDALNAEGPKEVTTAGGVLAPSVTSPPVARQFASASSDDGGLEMSTTMTLTMISGVPTSMPVTVTVGTTWYVQPTPFNPPTPTTSDVNGTAKAEDSASGTPGKGKVEMVYLIVITALVLMAVCVCFWVWSRYWRKGKGKGKGEGDGGLEKGGVGDGDCAGATRGGRRGVGGFFGRLHFPFSMSGFAKIGTGRGNEKEEGKLKSDAEKEVEGLSTEWGGTGIQAVNLAVINTAAASERTETGDERFSGVVVDRFGAVELEGSVGERPVSNHTSVREVESVKEVDGVREPAELRTSITTHVERSWSWEQTPIGAEGERELPPLPRSR